MKINKRALRKEQTDSSNIFEYRKKKKEYQERFTINLQHGNGDDRVKLVVILPKDAPMSQRDE